MSDVRWDEETLHALWDELRHIANTGEYFRVEAPTGDPDQLTIVKCGWEPVSRYGWRHRWFWWLR